MQQGTLQLNYKIFDEVFMCRVRFKDKGITITKTFCEAI
jgi:hypothetical protein